MKKVLVLLGIMFSVNTVFSQNIIKAEYFFDVDQGQGKGIAISNVTVGETVTFPLDIATTQLSNGFHFLNIRVADVNGVWSRYETRYFFLSTTTTNTTNIIAAEYFIDRDTIPGKGVPINIGSPGPVVNFIVDVPASLSSGFHSLAIRVKDQEGKWSIFEERRFYIIPEPVDAPPIVAAEYFYDVDPGIGNASSLAVTTPGDVVTQTFLVPVPINLTQGDHIIAIRVKDQQGNWSFYAKDTITVSNSSTISCPSNIMVTAAAGQCAAIVNGIDPTIAPAGASYTYTMNGATIGTGTGTVSGKTFNAGVTTVTYALNNSPSTNCSFTVTVNTDVIPVINLNASATDICPGQQVVFTTLPFNGGAAPSYQWKLNGNNIPGATGSTYQSTALANGDKVSVLMTSSLGCANPQSDLSEEILINVTSTVVPSVNLGMSATTICTGMPVNFIAMPTNGGTSPTYQWKLNGNIIPGVSGSTYQSSTLANGDKVTVTMTSSLACASPQTATSGGMPVTVTSTLPPSVYVEYSATTICAGTTASFVVTPGNGGPTPSYQWKVNGNNAGTNSDTFSSATLNNGDKVTVTMTSSLGCASPQTVTSTPITMTVLPSTPPAVNISASATAICTGSSVTFNVTLVTAGAGYQWQLNGNNIQGATGTTYQTSSLQNGDKVKVIMTPSSPCYPSSPITSNEITMSVNGVTPSVSIDASATTICSGQSVTFTATPVNGGNNPVYEWMVNNSVVGSNSNTFTTSSLQNGNVVKVSMVSSMACANPWSSVSNAITMSVGTALTPSVNIQSTAIDICAGQQVTFTATPTNGGNNPSYQWKLNGNNVGTNSATYQSSSLNNADTIRVMMTTSLSCAGSPGAMSNYISMDVTLPVSPSVNIAASATSICQGQTVTFTATPTNGGTQPYFEWKINGNNVLGTSSSVYPIPNLQNGDMVTVEMSTSLTCTTLPSATSNAVTIIVAQLKTYYADFDKDGYGNGASGVTDACVAPAGYVSNNGDCDDNNASIHPGATEICGNGIDDDCDGQIDEGCAASPDNDNDGYTVVQGDCNDNNASVHPGATETCGNGIDDDCDGQIDEGCAGSPDNDGDGYTVAQGDCNDNNASVHPGATEICGNGIDDDCDDQTDEGCNVTLPTLTLRTYPIKEGDIGQTILNVEVTLSLPAPLPVTVHYSTSNEDATAGSDYIATSGSLVIPAGATSGSVQVRIVGDLLKESNERFRLNFSDPVNVILNGDAYSRIMIIDDDKGKPNSVSPTKDAITEVLPFKIPTVTKRNSVWMIPQIGNYENDVMILNVQGQIVSRFINYKNQTPVGNVASGLYFYRIQIKESSGQLKYYTGRLLITE